MTQLRGAHLLVTGGSEGIGLEVARLALARGARVSVIARDEAKLRGAACSLGAVLTASADVTDPVALQAAIDLLTAQAGPVQVLVAAAGGAEPGRFAELDLAVLQRQMQLNHFGAVHAVRAVLPAMRAAGRGHVVLVSSAAGLCGVYGYAAYSPAKAALQNLAEVLRAEHGDDGLVVSVAYPPDTLTPGFDRENLSKPPETAAVSALVAPVPPEQVARAVVRGIEAGRRTITADRSTALLARATSVVAPVVRVAMRRAVRSAR